MTAEDTPSPGLDGARAAADADPSDPDLQIRLAVELVEVGDPDASAVIARATELAPEDPAILTRAAILSFDNGELDAAKQLVHRAYEHAPEGFGGIDWLTFVLGRVLCRRALRPSAPSARGGCSSRRSRATSTTVRSPL
ncbi:MAG TPA: hypothetical protein VGL51_06315 [Solirubrobacteraceae bacterium]|jgi:hypothetical protein